MQVSENFVTMVVLTTLIVAMTTVVVLPWLVKARDRMKIHETLRYFADKGQAPPSELLTGFADAQQRSQPRSQRDLRAGIFWLSLAAGIAGIVATIVASSDPGEVSWVMVPGLAALPGSIGMGYVLLWFMSRDKQG